MKHIAIVVAAVALAGCTTTNKDSGNFTRFFIDSLNQNGAQLDQFDMSQFYLGIPEYYTDWTYQADSGGFVILMRSGKYPYVASGLKRILGKPSFTGPNADHEIWTDVAGVHVDLVRLGDGRVQITCRHHPFVAKRQTVQR